MWSITSHKGVTYRYQQGREQTPKGVKPFQRERQRAPRLLEILHYRIPFVKTRKDTNELRCFLISSFSSNLSKRG